MFQWKYIVISYIIRNNSILSIPIYLYKKYWNRRSEHGVWRHLAFPGNKRERAERRSRQLITAPEYLSLFLVVHRLKCVVSSTIMSATLLIPQDGGQAEKGGIVNDFMYGSNVATSHIYIRMGMQLLTILTFLW